MPRLAEKLLVILCAAGGQGASSDPTLCAANADCGDMTSCCSCKRGTQGLFVAQPRAQPFLLGNSSCTYPADSPLLHLGERE